MKFVEEYMLRRYPIRQLELVTYLLAAKFNAKRKLPQLLRPQMTEVEDLGRKCQAEPEEFAHSVVRTIDRISRWSFGMFTCLHKSIAAATFLRRYGHNATVVIGTLINSTTASKQKGESIGNIRNFYAHAWIEVDGRKYWYSASVESQFMRHIRSESPTGVK